MSAGDRLAVPTNGHRPALHDDALDAPHHDAAGSPEQPVEPAGASDAARVADPAASSTSLPTIRSGQVVAGVGVLAALALLLLGRRRGRD